MSNFVGVTFAEQKVTPSDDAIIRQSVIPDSILTGCAMTYSGYTLTMAPGFLLIAGREIRHTATDNWAITDASSGYARLVLTIDLTLAATRDNFEQVNAEVQYASSVNGFGSLAQGDINGSATKYQVAACVVSLGNGGITGIVSKLSGAWDALKNKLDYVSTAEAASFFRRYDLNGINIDNMSGNWSVDISDNAHGTVPASWVNVRQTSSGHFYSQIAHKVNNDPNATRPSGDVWVRDKYQNKAWSTWRKLTGALHKKLVWENASPGSGVGAASVVCSAAEGLDIVSWDIIYLQAAGNLSTVMGLEVPYNAPGHRMTSVQYSSGPNVLIRQCAQSGTTFSFEVARSNGAEYPTALIPIQIFANYME